MLAHSFLKPPGQGSWNWLTAPLEWRAPGPWILAMSFVRALCVCVYGRMGTGNDNTAQQKSSFPQHYSRGQNECFDDFGITPEYLKPLCFTAGPLRKAQALSIQAMASCKHCLYLPRSDGILASNHRKKETRWWRFGGRNRGALMSPAA